MLLWYPLAVWLLCAAKTLGTHGQLHSRAGHKWGDVFCSVCVRTAGNGRLLGAWPNNGHVQDDLTPCLALKRLWTSPLQFRTAKTCVALPQGQHNLTRRSMRPLMITSRCLSRISPARPPLLLMRRAKRTRRRRLTCQRMFRRRLLSRTDPSACLTKIEQCSSPRPNSS